MKQVVISVYKGIAEIAYSSPGVEVAIVDQDGDDYADSGEGSLDYWVAKAKEDEGAPVKFTVAPVGRDTPVGYAVYLCRGEERHLIACRDTQDKAQALADLLQGALS